MIRNVFGIIPFVVLALLLTTGCGGDSYPSVHWKGNVTIDGQPVPSDAKAEIMVRLVDARKKSIGVSAKIVDGAYDLPKVPQGDVMVEFSIYRETPSKHAADAGRGIMDTEDLLPKWLRNGKGLRETAGSDNLSKNFDLTKNKPKD
ncbi:MAG: hypothetical protein Q4D38_07220 [Planctomycetia bacterium]|nr:hypothetical protein [Planctomycetia bacterium]